MPVSPASLSFGVARDQILNMVIENVQDIIWAMNAEGSFIYVSPSVEHVLGYTVEEFLALKQPQVLTPASYQAAVKKREERLESKQFTGTTINQEHICKDGSTKWCEVRAIALLDENKEPIGLAGITRDISERLAAEQARKEERDLVRQYLDIVGVIIVVVGRDGRVTLINRKGAEILGYALEDIVGKNWFEHFLPPQKREEVRGIHQRLFEGKDAASTANENLVLTRSGEERVIEWRNTILRDSEGTIVAALSSGTDITERKQAEKVLRESEERFRTIFHTSPDALMIMRLADDVLVDANDEFFAMTDYTRAEIVGTSFLREVLWANPDDRRRLKEVFLANGRLNNEEARLRTKEGRNIPTLLSASIIQLGGEPHGIGIFRNFEERQKIEEALRKSEEKYRFLVENANDIIVIVQDEYIRFFNQRALEITGFSAEEVLSAPATNFVHAADRDLVEDRRDRRLAGENPPNNYPVRIQTKSGEERWMDLNTIRIPWEDRPATLNFLRDITHNRKLEAQLQQAQKMEAVGTLAGGIAHDFNNILMGLEGHLSLLSLDLPPDFPAYESVQSSIERMQKLIQSGAGLTSQLLGFARKGRYELRILNLNQLLMDISQTFDQTRKEVTIHHELEPGLHPVKADPGQLEQMILNLCINAADAMPGGGDLTLRTRNATHQDIVSPEYEPPLGEYVCLEVTDSGVGLSPEIKDRIFEPFFTTKEMGRGVGLGLASVYGIVKGHDGFIQVHSIGGQGSTFAIYLPASSETMITEAKESTKDRLAQGQETILLIDDEEPVRFVAVRMLEKLGYKVLAAASGQEGIDLFRQEKEIINLVILDMIMPRMSGGDTFDQLASIKPDVKVLLSSGYSINGQAKSILDRGCKGFIQKPFSLKSLSEKIRETLTTDS